MKSSSLENVELMCNNQEIEDWVKLLILTFHNLHQTEKLLRFVLMDSVAGNIDSENFIYLSVWTSYLLEEKV